MIPDITYLILNYNPAGEAIAEKVLGDTIDAFYQRKSKSLTSTVYFLDQGTTPGHLNYILSKKNQYGFSLISLRRNIGIGNAINFIASVSKSFVIGLITSDVIPTTGMDEDLYSKLLNYPEISQVLPLSDKSDLLYQTEEIQDGYGADAVGSIKKDEYIRCIGAEFNVMFWRRSIFDRIGFFDGRWRAGYENIDYSLRCFLDGGCTAISKNSYVWHYHKMTHKNKSNVLSYQDCTSLDWRTYAKQLWTNKWPDLTSYIDIYKPLGGKTITHYPLLYARFHHNIKRDYDCS